MEDVPGGKENVPDGLGFESLMLLHHEFKDRLHVQDDNGDVHDDERLLGVVDLARLRHSTQLLRAVTDHHLLQGVHVGSEVLFGQNGLDLAIGVTAWRQAILVNRARDVIDFTLVSNALQQMVISAVQLGYVSRLRVQGRVLMHAVIALCTQ